MSAYVITHVQMHFGKLGEYHEVVEDLHPVMGRHGWKLIGAYASVFGRLNEVINVWEVDDPEVAHRGLSSMAGDPEFMELAGRLAGLIAEEHVHVYEKAPYHPG